MYYYFPMGFPGFWGRLALKLGVGEIIMKRDTCNTIDKCVPTDSYIQTTFWGDGRDWGWLAARALSLGMCLVLSYGAW